VGSAQTINDRELSIGAIRPDRPDDLDRLLATVPTLHPDGRAWKGDDLDTGMIALGTPDPFGQSIPGHPIVGYASGAGRQLPA
jgi:hypothetical protein